MNTTARESTRAKNIMSFLLKKNATDKQPTYVESGCSDINIHVYKII